MITSKSLSKLAATGDADAQFRLAYRSAFGVDRRQRNLNRAFRMWKASAGQGHLRAMFYLGTCYDFGSGVRRDINRAMFWYRQAAHAGHEVAQYNLALGYRDGLGVPRSRRMAVKWFRLSAASGNAEAMNELLHDVAAGEQLAKFGPDVLSVPGEGSCAAWHETILTAADTAGAAITAAVCEQYRGWRCCQKRV